jgi:predicted AAA+ superfamily ATPase
MIRRAIHDVLLSRLREPRRFIQVLAGARQVGKTTLIQQVLESARLPNHYASADQPTLRDRAWIEQQWDLGRMKAQEAKPGAVLVLDEIQKVADWSNVVKFLWDSDTRSKTNLKVVLLGSSPLLLQRGLSESLAGRFEMVRAPHWSFPEMREAFGWNCEQYIYYGAYPGAAPLIEDPERWRRYIVDSLIETTISRDILLLTRVDKPALLRRLFHLACEYSGQILSYQKMLGQLQESGNTVTLAHYLDLLEGAGMAAGLSKYSKGQARQRGSSPKLLVLNTALMTAQSATAFEEARRDGEYWGRLTESAIGAHLFNCGYDAKVQVCYWRERNQEVDFVLVRGKGAVSIEVKSGRRKDTFSGVELFGSRFHPKRQLIAGPQGIPIEEFLSTPVERWFQ